MPKKPDPSNTSAAHDVMEPRIHLMNTLMGGTEALRQAGQMYLPKFPLETDQNYQERLQRTTLTNFFRRTIESLAGKPFSKPINLSEDMPQELIDISADIDRQGNNIDVFGRKAFQDCLLKGMTHILVEYPMAAVVPGETTLDDERKINAKPYFVFIPPESILAAYCEYRNGQEFLTHVRIYEEEVVRVGFDEVLIKRIRVLEPGKFALWEKIDKKWVNVENGVTSIDYIPLVTIYFDREEFMVSHPPLTDLAYINIAHWQSTSDQRNILTVARFPILAGSGLTDDESNPKLGPRQFLNSVSADGKYYYVEHTGAAITSGRQELEDLKGEMSVLGIELLQKSGNPTATAKAIDSAENLTRLQSLVVVFTDAINEAYRMAADWMKLPQVGTVGINKDFGLKVTDTADFAALQFTRQNGDISREQFIAELKRRGTVSEDYDPAKDMDLIQKEKDTAMADQQVANEMAAAAAAEAAKNNPPVGQ